MPVTIRGLSSMIKLMTKLCQIIAQNRANIRTYVPDANKAAFDAALDAILTACAVVEGIGYLLDGIGSNT